MSRKVCITACEGHTGFAIAELLLTNPDFSKSADSVIGLSLNPDDPQCKELTKMGAKIVAHQPGKVKIMADTLKSTGADAICVIPPTHQNKADIAHELIEATKKAGVPNTCFISSAGCDLADKDRQPRLREFIDMETKIMESKGDSSTSTGSSPVVIRAGFYAENLLLYAPQMKEDKEIPLPIGESHSFAPIALGDVAQVAAWVLSSKGKNGFNDKVRGQLIVLTGPKLCTGEELATNASQALGVDLTFSNISPAEAKRVLQSQAKDLDESEIEYLLEYYSLVREGKTNYISTLGFHDVTGEHPMEPPDFFKVYKDEMAGPSQNGAKRRKVTHGGKKH